MTKFKKIYLPFNIIKYIKTSVFGDVRTTAGPGNEGVDLVEWINDGISEGYINASSGGAGVTDGVKGDITVSAGGTNWQINENAVGTTEIANASVTDIKLGTGINVNKLGDGTINNTEFSYLNNVTSNIQDQLNDKQFNIQFKDEGINIGPAGNIRNINFVGANITASNTLNTITVDVSGSGGAVSDGDRGDVIVSSSGAVWSIDSNAVTFNKIQNISTDRLLGRDTAGTGSVEEIVVNGGIEFDGGGNIRTSAFTGDVTKTAGGTVQTIANDAVTNSKLANMSANTLKGNNTGSSADPIDLTVAQVKTMLNYTAGDISNAPSGNISAITTQAAINELDAEKQVDIQFQDEGTNLGTTGTVDTLNFTGAGVTASRTGNAVTVNIPGGGGGGGATNLTYTAAPAQGTVNSDTGTDAVIPARTGTNAGLMLPADIFGAYLSDSVPTFTQRPRINFKGGIGVSASLVDNPALNAIDITYAVQLPTEQNVPITGASGPNSKLRVIATGNPSATFASNKLTISCVGGRIYSADWHLTSADVQSAPDGVGSTNWVQVEFLGVGGNTDTTNYSDIRVPNIQKLALPSAGSPIALNNAGSFNYSNNPQVSLIAASGGNVTIRIIGLTPSSGGYLLKFTDI